MRRKIRGFRTYMDAPNEAGTVLLNTSRDCYCLECAGAYRTECGDWLDEYGNELCPIYRPFECVECGEDG